MTESFDPAQENRSRTEQDEQTAKERKAQLAASIRAQMSESDDLKSLGDEQLLSRLEKSLFKFSEIDSSDLLNALEDFCRSEDEENELR